MVLYHFASKVGRRCEFYVGIIALQFYALRVLAIFECPAPTITKTCFKFYDVASTMNTVALKANCV